LQANIVCVRGDACRLYGLDLMQEVLLHPYTLLCALSESLEGSGIRVEG
jgi:hypothetical protein